VRACAADASVEWAHALRWYNEAGAKVLELSAGAAAAVVAGHAVRSEWDKAAVRLREMHDERPEAHLHTVYSALADVCRRRAGAWPHMWQVIHTFTSVTSSGGYHLTLPQAGVANPNTSASTLGTHVECNPFWFNVSWCHK
jgi:hypothetical protein